MNSVQPVSESLVDGIQIATSKDVPGIARLGYTALLKDPVEGQRISYEKLQNLASECVLKSHNYAWVSLVDGEVVAALCALVHPQMVYERHQASVVQFYTTQSGEGIKLMRHFLKWARGMRKIKCIVFTLEAGADPRIIIMLRRLGLSSEMPILVEWR